MPSTSDTSVEVGSTLVFRSAGRDGVHWTLEHIGHETRLNPGRIPVRLRSGLTNTRRAAFMDQLKPWEPYSSQETAELLAHAQLVGEMVAEGMVERVAESLVVKYGPREFMVEVKVHDVTEEPIGSSPVALTTVAPRIA